MRSLILVLAMLCAYAFSATASAERFAIAFEPEPSYRQELGITMSYMLFNDSPWGQGDGLAGSTRHWKLADRPGEKDFLNFVMWRSDESTRATFSETLKGHFETLLKQTYKDLKLDAAEIAGDIGKRVFQKGYEFSYVDFRAYQLVTEKDAEGNDKEVKRKPFWGRGYSVYEVESHEHYMFLHTASDDIFGSVKDMVYTKAVGTFFIGKSSRTGLIIMFLIGIIILVGLGGGYYFMEKKKAEERKRRLRGVQDDYDDYDDDYDDYDDYDAPRGGRSSRGAAPARRGGGSSPRRAPEPPSRGGRVPRRR